CFCRVHTWRANTANYKKLRRAVAGTPVEPTGRRPGLAGWESTESLGAGGRNVRIIPAISEDARRRDERRPDRRACFVARRDRDGQGTACVRDSQTQPAKPLPLHRSQLRGASAFADRERVVRARE